MHLLALLHSVVAAGSVAPPTLSTQDSPFALSDSHKQFTPRVNITHRISCHNIRHLIASFTVPFPGSVQSYSNCTDTGLSVQYWDQDKVGIQLFRFCWEVENWNIH